MQNDILVIIPAYNEEESIAGVVNELCSNYPQYDYIVVNDGSTDDTASLCLQKHFNFLNLPVNLGIGGSMQTGYRYALQHGYKVVVQFDGDGQHNAKYIERLSAPILDGSADMCVGSRFIEKEGFQTSAMRRFGIRLLKDAIFFCTGRRIQDVTSGFRAIGGDLLCLFCDNYAQDYPEPESLTMALKLGYQVLEIPVEMNDRKFGNSSINAWKSAYYMIKVTLAILFINIIKLKHSTREKAGSQSC